jgi:hypothetical protein
MHNTMHCMVFWGRAGIYMNAVDTGWINDENPLEKAAKIAKEGFQTPIDEVSGRALGTRHWHWHWGWREGQRVRCAAVQTADWMSPPR